MTRRGSCVAWDYDFPPYAQRVCSTEMDLAINHLWNVVERAGESSSAFLRAWNACVALENQWFGRS